MRRFRIDYKEYLKVFVFFVIGVVVALAIGYAAVIFFNSNAVSYNNTNSTLSSTDVQGALDELINKCWTRSADYCPTGQYCEESFSAQFSAYRNINTLCTTGVGTNAYIDTGVKPSSTIGYFLEFKPRNISTTATILGASNTTNLSANVMALEFSSGNVFMNINGTGLPTGGVAVVNNTRFAMYYKYRGDNYLRLYGTRSSATAIPSLNKNIYLFALNKAGTADRGSYVCIARCIITDGDTVLRNYVACQRKSDGKLGLCDEATGTFNYGVGTFTYD